MEGKGEGGVKEVVSETEWNKGGVNLVPSETCGLSKSEGQRDRERVRNREDDSAPLLHLQAKLEGEGHEWARKAQRSAYPHTAPNVETSFVIGILACAHTVIIWEINTQNRCFRLFGAY